MRQALRLLLPGPSTATLVGVVLTGRRSAYGHQTSAREGGRTLAALRRRGLVDRYYSEFDRKSLWKLTPRGRAAAEALAQETAKDDGVQVTCVPSGSINQPGTPGSTVGPMGQVGSVCSGEG